MHTATHIFRKTRALRTCAIALLMLPLQGGHTAIDNERALKFFHTHTGESLEIVFKRDGQYIPEALAEINDFLSDFRTGDATEMDPELLDVIFEIRKELGTDATFEVISAYRSPKTNEMLRQRSGGVARNSQHVLGKAIDVRLRGVKSSQLRDTAISLQRGGVGYYESSDFVHIDTGRVRRW